MSTYATQGRVGWGAALRFMDKATRQADLVLTAEGRAETILLIEDEAIDDRSIAEISQLVPNLGQLGKEAFVVAF